MQTYDTYKHSGIDWLGKIPSHWEVKKLKYFGYIYPGLSGKKGDDFNKEFFEGAKEFVPFTTICNYSQIKDERFQYVKISKEEIQNIVNKNDLLFLMSSETLDDIAKTSVYLLDKYAYLNSFCKGFRIENSNLNSVFTNYLLSSKIYRRYYELCGRGFTRINIKQEYINDTVISLPPIHEQEAIAAFLDEKCAKIDALMEIKSQQIEKLKELRQLKIHQAVTKGLDANVELKDSSIDWIGEIPKYWEVKRLKFQSKLNNNKSNAKDSNLPYYGMENIESMTGRHIETETEVEGLANIFYKGNVLFGKLRPYLAKVHLAIEEGLCSSEFLVFEGDKYNNEYLFRLLLSPEFIKIVNASTYGAKMPRANSDFIINQLVPIPSLSEQEAIVAYLEEVTGKIDQAIAQKQEQIEKLKQYKQSLINEVVTGKVKVA